MIEAWPRRAGGGLADHGSPVIGGMLGGAVAVSCCHREAGGKGLAVPVAVAELLPAVLIRRDDLPALRPLGQATRRVEQRDCPLIISTSTWLRCLRFRRLEVYKPADKRDYGY
jgi:hypothetical protein